MNFMNAECKFISLANTKYVICKVNAYLNFKYEKKNLKKEKNDFSIKYKNSSIV